MNTENLLKITNKIQYEKINVYVLYGEYDGHYFKNKNNDNFKEIDKIFLKEYYSYFIIDTNNDFIINMNELVINMIYLMFITYEK